MGVEELKEAGLETEGMLESTSKLDKMLQDIAGITIFEDDRQTFKSTYDIITEIAEVYHELTDAQQATLLEALAGKRQGNILASALNNVDDIRKAYELAENSTGSAMREQEEYAKSIQYSLDSLKASLQGLSVDTFNSGFLKFFIDLANKFVTLTDKVGLFKVAFVALTSFISMKAKTDILGLVKNIGSLIAQFDLATFSATSLGIALKGAFQGALIVGAITLIAKGIDKLNVSLEEQKQKFEEAQISYAEAKDKVESISNELKTHEEELKRLLALDNPTYADQEQIDKLKEITEEMLVQEDLAKKAEEREKKKVAYEAVDTVEKEFGDVGRFNADISNNKSLVRQYGNVQNMLSDSANISELLVGYEEINKLIKQSTEEYNKLTEEEKKAYGESILQDIERYQKMISDVPDRIFADISTLKEQQSSMKDYYDTIKDIPIDKLSKEQKELLTTYNSISDVIRTVYTILDPTKLDDFTKSEEDLGEQAKKTNEELSATPDAVTSSSAKAVKANIKEIEQSIAKLNKGKFDNGDLMDILEKFPELDKSKVDFSNFSGLKEELQRIENVQLDNLIKSMQEAGAFKTPQELENFRSIMLDISNIEPSNIENIIYGMKNIATDLSTLNDAFKDFNDNGVVSQKTLEKFSEAFGDLDGFDSFITKVTKSGVTSKELDKALEEITNEYLDNSEALDTLNLGTVELIANTLKENGIMNGLEVVLSRLGLTTEQYSQIKDYANKVGIDLCNITNEEAIKLLDLVDKTGQASQAFADFTLQKINTNLATVDTSGDIKNIGALIQACNGGAKALSALADAKMLMERANKGDSGAISQLEALAKLSGTGSVEDWYTSLMNKAQDEVNNALSNANNRNLTSSNYVAPEYKPPKKKEKAEKKTKEKKETVIDYTKNTIDSLKDSYEDLARATSELEKNDDLTNYYEEHAKAINDENDALKKLIGTESKRTKDGKKIKGTGLKGAKESYENSYEDELNKTGNADKYRKLIENGTLDVKTYKGELGEHLKNAIDYYGKIRDTDNEIASYQEKITDNNQKLKTDEKEIAEYKLEEAKHNEDVAKNNKEKNEAIDEQIEQQKELKRIALETAKSSEEKKKIEDEYDTTINGLKNKKTANNEDTNKLKLEELEADKELAKSYKEKNKIIDDEIKARKKVYEEALSQAKTDEEKARLEREYYNDIKSYKDEQLKNTQDEYQLQYDLLDSEKNETKTCAEKNQIIEKEKYLRTRIYNVALLQAKTDEERNRLQKEFNTDIKALDDEQTNNITNAKNSYISLQESILSLYEAELDNKKSMGTNITEADYGTLINQQLHIKQLYQEQYEEQEKILSTLEPTSELWSSTVDIMSNAQQKIMACDKAIISYKDDFNQTKLDTITKEVDYLGFIIDEIDDTFGMMDDSMKKSQTGMTLYQKKLSLLEAQRRKNSEALASLDKNSVDYYEKANQLASEQRDIASQQLAIYNELSDIKIDEINEETKRVKDLVDQKKKENEEEYNKLKLSKETKKNNESIAKIEAKIAQLKANNGDGANSKLILKLESDLAKKKEELDEKTQENAYNIKQDALDKEYESVEKANEKEIEAIQKSNDKKKQITENMLGNVSNSYGTFFTDINGMASQYGITMSDSLKSPWTDAESAVQQYMELAKQAMAINPSGAGEVVGVGTIGNYDNEGIDSFTKSTSKANNIKNSKPTKPEKSKEEKILDILMNGKGDTAKSPLNKYIIGRREYGHKPISYQQMSELFNLLTGSNTTKADFKGNDGMISMLLAKLRNAGFKDGGLIEKANSVIRDNGDNVLMTAKTGESVLTEVQTKALQDIRPFLPDLSKATKAIIDNKTNQQPISLQFDNLINIEGNTDDRLLGKLTNLVQVEAPKAIENTLKKYKK